MKLVQNLEAGVYNLSKGYTISSTVIGLWILLTIADYRTAPKFGKVVGRALLFSYLSVIEGFLYGENINELAEEWMP